MFEEIQADTENLVRVGDYGAPLDIGCGEGLCALGRVGGFRQRVSGEKASEIGVARPQEGAEVGDAIFLNDAVAFALVEDVASETDGGPPVEQLFYRAE